ncbi:MAG: hypothetical protein LAO20_01590 [Acidobacteriia bacterium]|nr:hypothetical protein [Terriglobia bacterium]
MTETATTKDTEDTGSHPRFHRLMKNAFSHRAKTVYIRVYTVILFVLGCLLTFSPHVFEFFKRFTQESPLLLPVTLLVPYIYFIFEMVVSRLEEADKSFDKAVQKLEEAGRPDASVEQAWLFEARRAELDHRRFERKMVVEAFIRSVTGLPNHGRLGTQAVVEWIAAERGPEIEVQILAYSSETLLDGLIDVANRIKGNAKKGVPAPQRIVFRLLTRDLNCGWRIPCLSSREADEVYRHGLRGRFGQYLSRWQTEFSKAFNFIPQDQLELEVRWYQFEPLFKAVIVNRKIGVIGVYDVHEVERGQGWDYHGQGVDMYEVNSVGPDQRSQLGLSDVTQLFEEIWSQHSSKADIF